MINISKKVIQRRFVWLLLVIGSVVWSIPLVRSGITYDYGMGFWGPNAHDGLWHIAIINTLSQGKITIPIFSGENIKNYHIGFDLLLSLIHRISGVSPVVLYFQIVPPIFSLAIGYLVYKLVYKMTESYHGVYWTLFFTYFGGGFGWLVSIIRNHTLGGDSMFWAQSSATTLINPPYALSLIILLSVLYLIISSDSKRNNTLLVLLVVLASITKVYLGVLLLLSIFVFGLIKLISSNDKNYVRIFIVSGIISFALNYYLNRGSTNLLVISPFWFLETMMIFPDRLDWERFYNAMVSYKQSTNYFKGVIFYFLSFIIFMLGNLGTRVMGLMILANKSLIKRIGLDFIVFASLLLFFGILIPLFIIQKGTPWNTIQFFYYSTFILGLMSGFITFSLLESAKRKITPIVLGAILIVFTLPTTYITLGHYCGGSPHAYISNNELEALSFLNKQEDGVVLDAQVLRDIEYTKTNEPFVPIHIYESTSYISALSGKPLFYGDEMNLDILGYKWGDRREEIINILSNINSINTYAYLRKNAIEYIYLVKRPGLKINEDVLGAKNVFENETITVYKVL